MTSLVIISGALFLGTLALLYLNWKILKVTERLLDEPTTIRKDTSVMRKDTRRVADSFNVNIPVPTITKPRV